MSAPVIVAHDPGSREPGPVRFAASVARLSGAPLLVVSVHGHDSDAPDAAAHELGETTRDAAHEGLAALERDVPELADVDANLRAVAGHSAARGIHRVAEDENAGLVVVGSSHHGRSERAIVGSTAERVVHGAPCPVAVVPGDFAGSGIETVGVAFLPSQEGGEALHAGAVIAAAAGAKLRVIALLKPELGAAEGAHADPRGVRTNERRAEAAAAHEREMRSAIADALSSVPDAGEPQVDVEFGEPQETLVAVSRHVDVLVMGSRGYGPHRAVLLGGVSRRVSAEAECPVIVIPRGVARPLEDLLRANREPA
jgi:nucleotide-binding universal stress UspA family protein